MTHRELQTSPGGQPPAFHAFRFYVCACAIAWTAWTPLLLHKFELLALPLPYPVVVFVCQTLGAFALVLSLFILQRFTGDSDLVARVFRKLQLRGVSAGWFVLAAVFPIVIAMVTALVHGLLSPDEGITILRPEPLNDLGWVLVAIIPFSFLVALIGSPLGEEPGWRGYLLDGFAARGRGLAGSGLVAIMWWIWHVPLFIILDVTPDGYSFLEMAGHSVLIDSLFLLSGRNLFVAMLAHQGVSTSFMFFASGARTPYGAALLIGLAIVVRLLAERRITKNSVELAESA